MVEGSDGNFYGSTYDAGGYGDGTVFKITPKGVLTTLLSFDNNGANPTAALIQATDGNFYGTASDGDGLSEPCVAGCAFEMTASGSLTDLFSFANPGHPAGGLVQATNGKFYGTASIGPAYTPDSGTVFELDTGLGLFVAMTPTFGNIAAKVIILGTDLRGTTSVTFNGTAATFTVVSATEITTTVPTGATTGEVEVDTPDRRLISNVNFIVEE